MNRSNIEITDQTFMAFADVIGVAHYVAAGSQSTAIKRLDLYEAPEEIGGWAEIPGEALAPNADFFLEQRLKRVYGHSRQFYEFWESCLSKRRHSPELYVYGHDGGVGANSFFLQELTNFHGGLTNPLVVLD